MDFDKLFPLSISPVPAHDYITIDGAENFKNVQFVYMSGRVVKQFGMATGNIFNIQDLSAGVYLVRLISDSGISTLKMIKE